MNLASLALAVCDVTRIPSLWFSGRKQLQKETAEATKWQNPQTESLSVHLQTTFSPEWFNVEGDMENRVGFFFSQKWASFLRNSSTCTSSVLYVLLSSTHSKCHQLFEDYWCLRLWITHFQVCSDIPNLIDCKSSRNVNCIFGGAGQVLPLTSVDSFKLFGLAGKRQKWMSNHPPHWGSIIHWLITCVKGGNMRPSRCTTQTQATCCSFGVRHSSPTTVEAVLTRAVQMRTFWLKSMK